MEAKQHQPHASQEELAQQIREYQASSHAGLTLSQCEQMDDTAQISTTLTEGLRTLQVEGLQLDLTEKPVAPCDLITKSLLSMNCLGAVA